MYCVCLSISYKVLLQVTITRYYVYLLCGATLYEYDVHLYDVHCTCTMYIIVRCTRDYALSRKEDLKSNMVGAGWASALGMLPAAGRVAAPTCTMYKYIVALHMYDVRTSLYKVALLSTRT